MENNMLLEQYSRYKKIAELVKTLYGVKWISISKIKNVYTKNLQKKYVI